MIIQCEKCRTKFRLDDSRVKEKGVKVRCTKCKNVFRVQKEAASLEQQCAAVADTEIHFDTNVFEDTATDSKAVEPCAFEADDFAIANGENTLTTAVEPTDADGNVDFSGFDFGEINSEPVSASSSTLSADDFMAVAAVAETPVLRKEIPQGLDFSDDDMFGTAVQPVSEVVNDAITFDFEGDSFVESMDMSGQDSRSKSSTSFALGTSADEPFNLGEIDFGDELTSVAVQQVNPDNLKQSQEILFSPLAETQDKVPGAETPLSGDDVAQNNDELPPLSISSRRKQNPFFGVVVGAISIMVILIVGYLGYLGFASVSTQKESGVKDSGKISVKEVKAVFVENDQAGELLVISGEALNEFSKQRASLQVKVTVFDSTGQSIATKSAYGGNPLTEEQLESLPLDKIETVMANQFGDSLANMGVASGDSIPFVVVLANLPKGAKDFVVEPVGSTVATGKQ